MRWSVFSYFRSHASSRCKFCAIRAADAVRDQTADSFKPSNAVQETTQMMAPLVKPWQAIVSWRTGRTGMILISMECLRSISAAECHVVSRKFLSARGCECYRSPSWPDTSSVKVILANGCSGIPTGGRGAVSTLSRGDLE